MVTIYLPGNAFKRTLYVREIEIVQQILRMIREYPAHVCFSN
jgi:hypothetical protein